MRAPPIDPPIIEVETWKVVASGVKEEGIEVVCEEAAAYKEVASGEEAAWYEEVTSSEEAAWYEEVASGEEAAWYEEVARYE